MVDWIEGPFAALDFETTGTNPLLARPVEVAFAKVDAKGNIMRGTYHKLVNSYVEIPEDATKIHGITNARVEKYGAPVDQVVWTLSNLMNEAKQEGIPVVIYNAPYDWTILKEELNRWYVVASLSIPYVIDPLVMDRMIDKFRKGGHKLTNVAESYGITLTNAHSALEDAVAAAKLARAMLRKFWGDDKKLTLADISRQHKDWHNAWKTNYVDYWKKKGEERSVLEWPF